MNSVTIRAKNAVAWLGKRGINARQIKTRSNSCSPLIEISTPCQELTARSTKITETFGGLQRYVYAVHLEGCFIYWR